MAVAALLDLGADREKLLKVLGSIPADGFKVEISDVVKNGIKCCDFNVLLDKEHENHDHDTDYLFGHDHHQEHEHHHHHEHRNLGDILHIIGHTDLSENAKNLAEKIFRIVAEAESKAHGVPLEDSLRGLSLVTTISSAVSATARPISGRFIGSRSPPAPNTAQTFPGVKRRTVESTLRSASSVCA